MNVFKSFKSTKPRRESRHRARQARATLDAELRQQPVAAVDETLCRQIMEAVQQADSHASHPAPVSVWWWILPPAGAVAALAVALLVVLRPSTNGVAPAPAHAAAAAGILEGELDRAPANSLLVVAQQEKKHLVSDTRQIAAFLSSNLRL